MIMIEPKDIAKVLGIGLTYAYKVIRELQEMQRKEGFYAVPKAKLPLKYFCDKMCLDFDEVMAILKDDAA